MKILLQAFGLGVASLATLTTSLATFSPLTSDGPTYNVGIPSSSTISASAKGGIYLSLSASTDYQWVGLGIGRQMAGATIFVMYADGSGNVTISGRDGNQGHVEPLLDSSLMEGVTLLEGSGVVNGTMTANVYCTTCTLLSSSTSSSSPWIAAWSKGAAYNSNSASYSIDQHGGDDTRQFTFDLTQATLSTDANPFVSSSPSSSSPSSNSTTSPGGSTDSDSGSSSSSSTVVGTSEEKIEKYDKAHGVIMGVTVVVLFPSGALFMRSGGHTWVHAGIQIVSLGSMIVGLGLGVKLAQFTSNLFNNTHTIFGVAIVALFLVQPLLGLVHHYLYQKSQSRNMFSHLHIWYGRILMVLAVVNGGLGLKLAANSRTGKIVYGVIAGVIGLVYIVAVAVRRKGAAGVGTVGRNGWRRGEKVETERDASL